MAVRYMLSCLGLLISSVLLMWPLNVCLVLVNEWAVRDDRKGVYEYIGAECSRSVIEAALTCLVPPITRDIEGSTNISLVPIPNTQNQV